MCVLHNLSYRLDAKVPTRYRQLEYNARNTYTEKSSTGCFSNKSDKMLVSGRPLPPSTLHPPPGPGLPTSLPTGGRRPPGAGQGASHRLPFVPLCAGIRGDGALTPLRPGPRCLRVSWFPRDRRGRAPEGRFTPRAGLWAPARPPAPGTPRCLSGAGSSEARAPTAAAARPGLSRGWSLPEGPGAFRPQT